jgi:hypothetical protein
MGVARTRTRVVLVSAITIVLGVACGIDAVGVAPVGDGDGGTSSGASSGATSSGASSSGTSADGASGGMDAPACTPSGPEVCEDGVDNDCNGQKDCEDTACAQFACTKTEADWTFVSVRAATAGDAGALDAGDDAADGGGLCAPGWTNGRTLLDNIRASGATCGCVCGAANGNPCANGTRTVNFRTGSTNCNDGSGSFTLDGVCRALSFTWSTSYNGADVQPPASIVPVSCATTSTLPPVVDDGAYVVCDKAPGTPATCTNGACVLKPGTDKICLMRAGDAHVCPAAYPTRKVLAPTYTDGRTCNACSCTHNATTCGSRQLSFYTNAGCTQGQRTVAASNACSDISGTGTPTHYRYEATPDGACAPASATVGLTGGVTLTTPSTLCCPP